MRLVLLLHILWVKFERRRVEGKLSNAIYQAGYGEHDISSIIDALSTQQDTLAAREYLLIQCYKQLGRKID